LTSATPETLTVTPLEACAVGSILIWRARSEIISARCVSGLTRAPPPVITEMRDDSPLAFFWLLPTTTSAWSALATLYHARTMISRKIRRTIAATTAMPTITSAPPAARISTLRTHFLCIADVLRPYRTMPPDAEDSADLGITPRCAGHALRWWHDHSAVPAARRPLRPAAMNPSDEKLWATLVHVGGIFYFLPSLIGYLVLKDRGPFVRRTRPPR
jgi:hypothetical protein